jgi:hypothetical protein
MFLGCKEQCGRLLTTNNNITEGDSVVLQFYVDPGKDVTFEKKDESTFRKLYAAIKVTGEKKIHTLDILKTKYSDRGNYRVNCGETVSNSVYLNIGNILVMKMEYIMTTVQFSKHL